MGFHKPVSFLALLVSVGLGVSELDAATPEEGTSAKVMLILRGIANSENPRGQLDDRSALEYAQRLGFQGEVLNVAGDAAADSAQVRMALDCIRRDDTVTAIYGFSGGGYNARLIWGELTAEERGRIRTVVVIGSPGITHSDFVGAYDVIIKHDPPEGHMAGPKALLESLP
jgi:hypothetical protein